MIGTYYRLSLADEDVSADKAESNSIQGQRGLVEGYIMARPELATEPRQEYVDDGYSGTSTSRPAFQRLIQDAQDGKVKTIIVKDFSRFARDYIEAGDYMEQIFPLLGVRFISVNDGYDSGMQAGNDVRGLEVAIKNIINASYSRDLSAKIAAADHVMQKKGMYLGGYRPFGFLPDPNDCYKLILDPVASQYVRLIFELALQGNRTGTIAKILNEKQIPTPAAYHVAESHVYSEQKAWDLQRSHWTSGTVYHVLKNEKYKGTYVGAKFIMPVPCKHRVLRAPLEQQVRIEDSHAAIVTPEEFEQAQKVIMLQNGNHQSGNYTKHQYPLKGKVYCGYCQKLMKYRVLKKLGPYAYGKILSFENQKQMLIPRGFTHGYLTLEDDTLMQWCVDNNFCAEAARAVRYDSDFIWQTEPWPVRLIYFIWTEKAKIVLISDCLCTSERTNILLKYECMTKSTNISFKLHVLNEDRNYEKSTDYWYHRSGRLLSGRVPSGEGL